MRFALPLIGLVFALASCQKGTDAWEESLGENCVSPIGEVRQIEGGSFQMGSDFYPEERPIRTKIVDKFDIDAVEVTNAQFQGFVDATGYVTDAEKVQPGFDKIGSAVFSIPNATNPNGWQFLEGANWRHPEGPDSNIINQDNYPVVQVSYADAKAYATWTGRKLPSESQWEYAAKGQGDTTYVWGEEKAPDGVEQANSWQGAFPIQNTAKDRYFLRAPVGCFPANDSGLYDMIGNVWEWTDTVYQDSAGEPIYTIKGGSFLCAPNYCRRYRAAARQPQEAGLPTNHIGFRTVSN